MPASQISSHIALQHHSAPVNGRGQGLVEYALILALVAVMTAGTLAVLGPSIGDVYSQVVQGLRGESTEVAEQQPKNTLLVSVVDNNGQGIAGLSVAAFTAGGSYVGQTTTSDIGEAIFTDLPDGGYKFRVIYYSQNYWSDPIIYPDQWQAVVQTGVRTVTVTAVDTDGQGVADALIHIFNEERRYVRYGAKSDDNGQVQFQLPAGRFTFRANYRAQEYWSDVVDTAVNSAATIQTGEKEITVRVTDAAGNLVTAYAHIVVFSETGSYAGISTGTKTGELTLAMADGRYKIRVIYVADNYWSDVVDTTIVDEVVINTGERPLTVRVVDGVGHGVADVPVYAFANNGKKYLSMRVNSGSDGTATFTLPDGSYTFRADFRGQQFWSSELISPAATETTLDLGIRPFTLTVADGRGKGIKDVRVFAYTADGVYAQLEGQTNNRGQVSWDVPTGRFKFRADYHGKQYYSEVITTPDSNRATITIDEQTVTVRVITAQGNGLKNVSVAAFPEGAAYAISQVTTNGSGRANFELPSGSYRFRTYLNHTELWSETVALPASDEVLLETGQRRVTVRVIDDNGRGLKDVTVYAKTADGSYVTSERTNGSGNAVFELVAGAFIFEADVQFVRFSSGTVDTGAENTAVITSRQRPVDFTVHDQDGDPLKRVWVGAYNAQGNFLGVQGKTDKRGQITFDLVAATIDIKIVVDNNGYWFRGYVVPGSGRFTLVVNTDE